MSEAIYTGAYWGIVAASGIFSCVLALGFIFQLANYILELLGENNDNRTRRTRDY